LGLFGGRKKGFAGFLTLGARLLALHDFKHFCRRISALEQIPIMEAQKESKRCTKLH
jgi:hypothetical protein